MSNTARQVKRAMERLRDPSDAKDALQVSNRCPHHVKIGRAFYANQFPRVSAIRVGDPRAERNQIEVAGLPFLVLERIVPGRESVLRAAREVLADPADVVLVSSMVMNAIDECERNEGDGRVRQELRRALAKIISPSLAKHDMRRGSEGKAEGTSLAFAHPLFLEPVTEGDLP